MTQLKRRVPLLALLPLLLIGFLGTPAAAAPLAKTPLRAIERYAPYQPQTTCSPTAKPGTVALRTLIMRAYGGTGDYGIVRDCGVGGRSEHKEGRAWDWGVSAKSPAQARQATDMLRWLLGTDKFGNKQAQARRLGVMYVIWNKKIWNAGASTWKPYAGADPHTSHVHISLGWAGALKKTSYWTGVVSGLLQAPGTKPAPAPRPTPKPKPTPTPTPLPLPTTLPTTPPITPPITVDAADSDGVTTTLQLVAGRRYLLTATGTYRYGSGAMVADPECSVHPDDGRWDRRSQWESDRDSWGHLDLEVQGESTRWVTTDGAPCALTSHSYVTELDPKASGPLTLKVVDDVYTDNSGSLSVTVQEAAPLEA